ncbi:D-ribose pyranase [Streptomyces turgidiscabies]|uniref:D-ribose pyranase n=1 Tax=Streptomyces turgidiscabies TaxID=85558 RepID=A0ABU0RRZ9_9ACTN|nr:D-ribose pyranase [Streptomyces turgidiscabies]MDQ0934756.1 D-ribose pyranase [Streptomyces turgidiscabies]
MQRNGIIHHELAGLIAGLRHTDTFVISDAGLPLPPGMPVVDLGYRYGQPSFVDVTETVLAQIVVEHSWVTDQVREINPAVHAALRSFGLEPEPVDHDEFKARVGEAKFAVRTGEDTFYANVLCRAGVPFTP